MVSREREQRQGFGRDADVALKPLNLAGQPVEAAGEGGLTAIRAIRRQEGRDSRLDNRRARQPFAVGEIRDLLQQSRREKEYSCGRASAAFHSSSPSAGSSDAYRARLRICWRRTRAWRAASSGTSSMTPNSSCAGGIPRFPHDRHMVGKVRLTPHSAVRHVLGS